MGDRELVPPALAAEELVAAPTVRDVIPRGNPVQVDQWKGKLPEYSAQGAKCARETPVGCFLTPEQRNRLVPMFDSRARAAQVNYKLAIEHVRLTKLMEKDDDAGWLAGLVLDLLGMYIGTTITSQLKKFRSGSQRELSKLAARGGISEGFESWGPTAHQLMSSVDDRQFDALIKPRHPCEARSVSEEWGACYRSKGDRAARDPRCRLHEEELLRRYARGARLVQIRRRATLRAPAARACRGRDGSPRQSVRAKADVRVLWPPQLSA